MNITNKFINFYPGRVAFFSLLVAAFLLVACGDTTALVPNTAAAAAVAATPVNANAPGAMMGQTPGSTSIQTPGAMMSQTPGGMMGNSNSGTANQLSVSDAKEAVSSYLNQLGNKELSIDEIMIFDNNAYVAIKDTKSGIGAFELLVNPQNKTVFPEYGPNMMWNLVYGYMSGNATNGMMAQQMNQMMGNGTNGMMGYSTNGMMSSIGQVNNEVTRPGKMPVTAEQALKTAQTYLDKAYPGVQTVDKADEYPGYYTVDVQKQGKVSGMLSVNGFTGQVWYHSWHGQFIEMTDFGK